MHCFIGIEVDDGLSNQMISLQKRWQSLDLPPADFHKHTDPHITLVPPFECMQTGPLIKELAAVGAEFPTFNLLFLNVDAFNHRILHLSVESNAVIELRAKLLDACADYSQVHDSHPFYHPHATVGYSRTPLTNRQLSAAETILEQQLHLPYRQAVGSYTLFGRSRPGTQYQTLANVQLTAQS